MVSNMMNNGKSRKRRNLGFWYMLEAVMIRALQNTRGRLRLLGLVRLVYWGTITGPFW